MTEWRNLIEDECDKIKKILIEKNEKYGNSALEPVRIFSSSNSYEQLLVRIDDKLSRILRGQGREDEDVTLDLIGYFILLRVAKKFEAKTKTSP